jgi:hypothetical protein
MIHIQGTVQADRGCINNVVFISEKLQTFRRIPNAETAENRRKRINSDSQPSLMLKNLRAGRHTTSITLNYTSAVYRKKQRQQIHKERRKE